MTADFKKRGNLDNDMFKQENHMKMKVRCGRCFYKSRNAKECQKTKKQTTTTTKKAQEQHGMNFFLKAMRKN